MDRGDTAKNIRVALPRDYGRKFNNPRLPEQVSGIGLGCSSFSAFFDSHSNNEPTVDTLDRESELVKAWINTVVSSFVDYGITLWDTAPWYGHGTSEVVLGWAYEYLLEQCRAQSVADLDGIRDNLRSSLCINTKVGRYEADPKHQFDFSYATTIASVERSLKRIKCGYIDVLQLHDPEFAPSLTVILEETIPAMIACQQEHQYCRALGLTGYPLSVQFQILQASMEKFGRNVWDHALTYGHYNLHDTSLVNQPILKNCNAIVPDSDGLHNKQTFSQFCKEHKIVVSNAAPYSMGLLTPQGPPVWHPASVELRDACQKARDMAARCDNGDVPTIIKLALLYALAVDPDDVSCTIIGMARLDQVQQACELAKAIENATHENDSNTHKQQVILQQILSQDEYIVLNRIVDVNDGPFSNVWKNNGYSWDGIDAAHDFWCQVMDGKMEKVEKWQLR